MSGRLLRERIILLVPFGLACLVFYLTQDLPRSAGGQISPGTFPRLVAGALGALALIRVFLPFPASQNLNHEDDWDWKPFLKSMSGVVLMVVYIALFGRVHFVLLTAAFVFVIFLVFDVRPVVRAAISAAAATAFLYVLFVHVLRISV